MANFELRIYVLDYENHEEVQREYNVTDVEYLTDEQFVEACESYGRVYTLKGFLGNDVVAYDKDVVRAYFVEVDNGNSKPVRADGYYTVISTSKITKNGNEVVLFEEA